MLASGWADRCHFEHGQPKHDSKMFTYSNLGQNIYVYTDTEADNLIGATMAFFNEKSDYDFDSKACDSVCGHYTQVRKIPFIIRTTRLCVHYGKILA